MTEREILDAMRSMLEPVNSQLHNMQGDIQGLKSNIVSLKSDIADVRERVLKIELTQENTIVPNIKLLAEGHSGVVAKLRGLDDLTERVEDIQNTVDVLKHIAVKK